MLKLNPLEMKTIIRLFSLLAIVAGLYSCDALDVEFDSTVSADLDLTSSAMKSALDTYTFSGSETMKATDDPEVEKYADKIKDYKVNSITAEVTSVSESGVVLLKDSYFKINDVLDDVMWTLDADFNVEVGNKYVFSSATGDFETVQKILRRNSTFTISGEGLTNTASVMITFNAELDLTITASPL